MAQSSLRSLGKQLSFDTSLGPDQDPEDEETQQDFETFKSWLEAMEKADAAASEAKPVNPDVDQAMDPKPSGSISKPKCPGCKLPTKMCILVIINLNIYFLVFSPLAMVSN